MLAGLSRLSPREVEGLISDRDEVDVSAAFGFVAKGLALIDVVHYIIRCIARLVLCHGGRDGCSMRRGHEPRRVEYGFARWTIDQQRPDRALMTRQPGEAERISQSGHVATELQGTQHVLCD